MSKATVELSLTVTVSYMLSLIDPIYAVVPIVAYVAKNLRKKKGRHD